MFYLCGRVVPEFEEAKTTSRCAVDHRSDRGAACIFRFSLAERTEICEIKPVNRALWGEHRGPRGGLLSFRSWYVPYEPRMWIPLFRGTNAAGALPRLAARMRLVLFFFFRWWLGALSNASFTFLFFFIIAYGVRWFRWPCVVYVGCNEPPGKSQPRFRMQLGTCPKRAASVVSFLNGEHPSQYGGSTRCLVVSPLSR